MHTKHDRRNRRKPWALLLALCLVTSGLNANALVTYAAAPERTFSIGENATVTLYEDGRLVLSGTGDTYDYEPGAAPFYAERGEVLSISIDSGITSLGNHLFYNCGSLVGTLTIPATVVRIGDGTFSGDAYETAPRFSAVYNKFVATDVTVKNQDATNAAASTEANADDATRASASTTGTDSASSANTSGETTGTSVADSTATNASESGSDDADAGATASTGDAANVAASTESSLEAETTSTPAETAPATAAAAPSAFARALGVQTAYASENAASAEDAASAQSAASGYAIVHITEQELGTNIFYVGQTGVLNLADEQNASFLAAAKAAGYKKVLSFVNVEFSDDAGASATLSVPRTAYGLFLPDYAETELAWPDESHRTYDFIGWQPSDSNATVDAVAPHSFYDGDATAFSAHFTSSERVFSEQTIEARVGDQRVSIAGNLPQGAQVAVEKVEPTTEMLGLVADAMGESEPTIAYALDIAIIVDGVKYQPREFGESVAVSVTNMALDMAKPLSIYHVASDEASGGLSLESVAVDSVAADAVSFTADSFSVYLITLSSNHTVTFSSGKYTIDYSTDNSTFTRLAAETVDLSSSDTLYFKVTPNEGYALGTVSATNATLTEPTSESDAYTLSNITGTSEVIIPVKGVEVSGIACLGSTLSATTTGLGTGLTYQWKSCTTSNDAIVDVSEATSASYTIPSTGAASYYRVTVTEGEATYTSAAVGPVTNAAVYTATGKVLNRLSEGNGSLYSGTGSALSVPANGSFTVQYNLFYNQSTSYPLTISFGSALPEGTKLTVLDVCASHQAAPRFFYYVVGTGGTSSVPATYFKQMGTTTDASFEDSSMTGERSASYQLSIELPSTATTTGDLTVSLKQNDAALDNTSVAVTRTAASTSSGSVSLTNTTSGAGSISAAATVSSLSLAPGKISVLAVSLFNESGAAVSFPDNCTVSIGGNDATSTIHGNLATLSGVTSQSYTIAVTGLEANTYQLKVDVCAVAAGSAHYPLGGGSLGSITSGSFTVSAAATPSYAVGATLTGGNRAITQGTGATLTFDVPYSINNAASAPVLTIVSQSKGSGVYTDLNPLWTVSDVLVITLTSGSATSTMSGITVSVPSTAAAGTYRLLFRLTVGNTTVAEHPYNVIIR